MESLHPHCLKCINRRCMVRPDTGLSCDLMGCPLVCGAVFHSCKLEEHRLLCPLERLPCLNSGFGCPFTVPRAKMARHLESCPASILCCTMEWNRWPVSYADRKSYENLSKDFDDVEQLDMALALQDQRMLLESLKVATTVSKNGDKDAADGQKMTTAPGPAEAELGGGAMDIEEEPYSDLCRSSMETSRNLVAALDILTNSGNIDVIVANLSGEKADRTGAACNGDGLGAYEGEKNVEMQDSDSESELGAVGGVDCAVGTDEEELLYWEDESKFVELCFEEKGAAIEEPIDDSSLVWPQMSPSFMPVVSLEAPVPQPAPLGPLVPFLLPDHLRSDFLQHLPSVFRYRYLEQRLQNMEVLRGIGMFTLNGRRALLSDPYLFRAKMEDKAVDTSDLEVPDDPMGLHGIDLITAALLFCLGDSPGGRGISDSRFVDGYHIDFGTQTFSFPSAILATNTMVGDIASASACDHASPQLSNPSPFHTLRLDLVLECVARYQTKQRSMFTFVCGQLFRRDEFSSHFKNVHGDIHAGLNGWMEQRCPLAYYGCTYSQRRFCPSAQGFRIIHDRHLGSFGVRPGGALRTGECALRKNCGGASQCDQFTSLPFEVLQHVASFLDSFSLCQLSRVSRTMREVCASLLQMRGMVVLLWEKRRRDDGSPSWQITNKVWRFSTAFGTVDEWKFANVASMADHLKTCKFNTVTRREEAIPLPCMCFTRELTREGRSLRSVLKPVA